MTEVILIEIVAVPAERSRGRHNPRVVKRKMNNFPSRCAASAAPSQRFRYDEHIVVVAPSEPSAPTTVLAELTDPRDRYEALTGRSLQLCPVCHTGHMERIGIVPAIIGRARALRVDAS